MTHHLKFLASTFAWLGRSFALCAVLVPAPIWAEESVWRLPAFAAQPVADLAVNVPNEQTKAPAPSKGWVLPAPSVRLMTAAQQGHLRPAPRKSAVLLPGPSAILTGFSGHTYARPLLPKGAKDAALNNPDYQTINLDGISVSFSNITDFGQAPKGSEMTRAAFDALYARQIGQVFGAVLDDANPPNLYLAASSAYGVQIVGTDGNGDGLPDRLHQGGPDARFMAGQWGDAVGAGPDTIWRVDGVTGAVEVFANLATDGPANTAPSLGNLAYDAAHHALFVSDLATGLISRFAPNGRLLEAFDHGQTARSFAGLNAVALNPQGATPITDTAFDPIDPATWGMAPDARRVWGVAVHQGRLYYAVAAGQTGLPTVSPQIWSVGLNPRTGGFENDARWEVSLPDSLPSYEISDIGFDGAGGMVVAQRGVRKLAYDFSQMAEVGSAEVLRFGLEKPQDNPKTPSVWVAQPAPYAVGFAGSLSNTTGGLAFGPGYDAQGRLDFTQCSGTLWTTGEGLRRNPDLQEPLAKGGSLIVDGVQAQPSALMRDQNTPPWISYSLDYDRKYPTDARAGYLGDVVVYGCAGGGQATAISDAGDGAPPSAPPEVAGDPPKVTGDPLCTGPSCILVICLLNPSLCVPPPPDKVCADSSVTVKCDGNGGYVAQIAYANAPATLSSIKLTDPSGQITALPQVQPSAGQFTVPLTGLVAGQVGQINLCSFDPAAAADGQPHDCCNTSVSFKIPSNACQPEVQE